MIKGIKAFKGKLVIKAVLRLESGMHIGASDDFAPIGAVDSPFIRDTYTKQPIIPGSSLKGKLRSLIARSMSESYVLNNINDDADIIKRMFGSSAKNEFHASRLIFTDIRLTKASLNRLSSMNMDTYIGEVKYENAIDRVTAVANPRQIERVPAGAEFELSLVYNIEQLDELLEDMELLADGMILLKWDYLGGHGSRGYGKVSFHDFTFDVISLHNNKNDFTQEITEISEIFKEVEEG